MCRYNSIKNKIAAINWYQKHSYFHPLTCGNNSKHNLLQPKLINNQIYLICTDCDYVQQSIPEVIFDVYKKKKIFESDEIFKHLVL